MTDKMLGAVNNALVAFGNYAYAMRDAQWEHPGLAFAKLEEEMRKLDDIFHETREPAND